MLMVCLGFKPKDKKIKGTIKSTALFRSLKMTICDR